MVTNIKSKAKINKQTLIVVLLAALALLLVPFIVNHFSGGTLLSEESYYHLRMINQFRTTGISGTDTLLQRPYSFNLFHALPAILGVGKTLLVYVIPVILGLISLFLVYLIYRNIEIEKDNILFSTILLISAPTFIYTFTTINPESLAFPIFLLGIYLFLKKNYISLIMPGILVTINIYSAIILLVIFGAQALLEHKGRRVFFLSALFFILAGGFAILFLKFNPLLDFVQSGFSLSSLFVTLGGVKGYSLIVIILAILGMSSFWERGANLTTWYAIITLFFIGSLFYSSTRIFAMPLIAFFSGRAISDMVKKHWNISLLKDVTILLIVCSILFSAVVFIKSEATSISPENVNAIKYLSATEPNDVILSSESNGFLIQEIANRRTYLDSSSYKFKDYAYRENTSNNIFYTRNLKELEKLFNESGINHILIDKNMYDGEIWNSPDEGVLFIFKNSNSFVKIFDNGADQIYRYVGKDLKN